MTRTKKPNRKHNTRHKTAANRPRAHNKRHNRSRNPAVRPIVTGAVFAALGAMATNIVAGFVPIRVSGWMGLAVKLGLAYGVGVLAERLGVSGANANYMAIGGFAGAAGEGIQMLLSSVGSGIQSLAPHQEAAPETVGYLEDIGPFPEGIDRYSLGDIGPVPSYIS